MEDINGMLWCAAELIFILLLCKIIEKNMLKPLQAKVMTYLISDTAKIPNNKRLPLLIYHGVFPKSEPEKMAQTYEKLFAQNQWSPEWRDVIYPFHHFHTKSHEALGVFQGNASVLFGGESGIRFNVSAGDMVIIPAGVGHKSINSSDDFCCVGGYPAGLECDMNLEENDNQAHIHNINQVPIPSYDPIYRKESGYLISLWQ
jgi:uncharacterized protein YjlB